MVGTAIAHPDHPQPRTAFQPPTRQDISVSSPLSPRAPQDTGIGGEASKGTPPQPPQPSKRETPAPILQPRVTVAEPAPPPVRREAPPPAPTIQVTIGRIEVRATPAAKAPVVERQAARPAVDLEEYLRQRSRGTGR